MKLYELSSEFNKAYADYADMLQGAEDALEAGEIDAEEVEAQYESAAELLEERLAGLQVDFSIKAENTALVIKNLEAEADLNAAQGQVIMDHAKPYVRRAKSLERRAASLKQYLLSEMERAGCAEVEGNLIKVALQASQPAVDVVEIEKVAPEFLTPVAPKVDRRGIVKLFKSGQVDIPGVIVSVSQHLRLRPKARP